MKPMDDKRCYDQSTNSCNFKFQKENGNDEASSHHHRKILGSRTKPTPSKWDDAQKWLVGLSGGGDHSLAKNTHRKSNADDRRLLGPTTQIGRNSCSNLDVGLDDDVALSITTQYKGETKKIDRNESFWTINKPAEDSMMTVRPVCVRDTGTEMTPIASKDPSRTATPLRSTTPVSGSPIASRSSTPRRFRHGVQPLESYQTSVKSIERKREAMVSGKPRGNMRSTKGDKESNRCKVLESEQVTNPDSLESRAMAWDEAERAKCLARYKREEVKLHSWENHEKRKAEMEMRRMEVKAERSKSRAQERLTNKLAATRRVAEEKRSNAEAKLHERAAKTSERSEYIRRTGHLPICFFSFKLPSLCS